MAEFSVSFDSIIKHFESLPDPRHTRNRRHELVDGCAWTLRIVDDQAGDAGMLNRWALVFPAVSTDCDGDGVPDTCQPEFSCGPGDMDSDGDVDLSDLIRFQTCFGRGETVAAACTQADIDRASAHK